MLKKLLKYDLKWMLKIICIFCKQGYTKFKNVLIEIKTTLCYDEFVKETCIK